MLALIYVHRYMKFNILFLEDQFLEVCPLAFHGWGMVQSFQWLAVAAFGLMAVIPLEYTKDSI